MVLHAPAITNEHMRMMAATGDPLNPHRVIMIQPGKRARIHYLNRAAINRPVRQNALLGSGEVHRPSQRSEQKSNSKFHGQKIHGGAMFGNASWCA